MSSLNLHSLTNSFQDVHLVGLASWPGSKAIDPCDRGGPYMVSQKSYDPEDTKVIADEFVLGRSGKWLSMSYFFKLPAKVVLLRPDPKELAALAAPETNDMAMAEDMAAAYQVGRSQKPGVAAETK